LVNSFVELAATKANRSVRGIDGAVMRAVPPAAICIVA